MTDTTQVERQLYILTFIAQYKQGVTLDDISRHLERLGIDVSRKTIERDIDYISSGSFFVVEEKREGKTYFLADRFGIKNMTFDFIELLSLYFIKELLIPYSNYDIGSTALKLIDNVLEKVPLSNSRYLEKCRELVKVDTYQISIDNHINNEFVSCIRDCIENKKTMDISYYSFNSDQESRRNFDPYFIEIYGQKYHVIGFDHKSQQMRDLRISRINDITVTDRNFKRPENFYEQYRKSRFNKLAGSTGIKLVLKFKGYAARYIREYESSLADKIEEQEDGTVIFYKSTTDTPEIKKWILGFGSGVEVLEPLELRENIMFEIQNMLNTYR